MSITLRFGAPLLPAGGFHFGDRGCGVLVESLPVGGQNGDSFLQQWTTGADNGTEVRLVVESVAPGLTVFFGEDGTATASAADGSYIVMAHLEQSYVQVGPARALAFSFGNGVVSVTVVEQGEIVAASVAVASAAGIAVFEQSEIIAAMMQVPSQAAISIAEQAETVAAHVQNGAGIQVPASRTVRFAGENRTVRF